MEQESVTTLSSDADRCCHQGTFLRWEQDLGTQDWTSTMSLVATALDGSAATFEFNGNSHFGFEVTRCF